MGLRFGIVPDFQPMRIVFLEQQTASVGYLLLDFAEHWGQVDLVSPAFQGDAHGLLQGGNGVEERQFRQLALHFEPSPDHLPSAVNRTGSVVLAPGETECGRPPAVVRHFSVARTAALTRSRFARTLSRSAMTLLRISSSSWARLLSCCCRATSLLTRSSFQAGAHQRWRVANRPTVVSEKSPKFPPGPGVKLPAQAIPWTAAGRAPAAGAQAGPGDSQDGAAKPGP